ncbi:MAG: SusC/RagA family TonB-linked outer membrane protein [Flavobacteriaceae bacterium]|nr:SusC/RagA family TonB-linked outer membrane protein [Flavobacteriaceae bacterium]
MKFNRILALLLALVVQLSFAQEKNVSGTVSDALGPVSDITVLVKGTDTGTVTDFDGNYTIKAKVDDVLVFSHISYNIVEKIVGTSNIIDLKLIENGNVLDIVVVTAQGVKREKKSLGYSQTTVKSEALEQRGTADISKVLQGKVAGVTISQTGVTGGGTGITIRGNSLLTESNGALIVVDGVPLTTGTNNDGFTGAGDIDSNRLSDIDPNNIASMSVLKGLAATVLYGNQGVNGVIIITTKTGSPNNSSTKKMNITVTSNTYFNRVANLPDFQNSYGSGFYLGNLHGANNSFGPLYNGEIVPHILTNNGTLISDFPELFDDPSTPNILEGGTLYSAKPNNVKDFFRTGVSQSTGVSISKSFESGGINASYSNTVEEGFIPNNSLTRDNFSLGGSIKLANNFSVNGTLNFVRNQIQAPPITAANGANSFSIFNRLLGVARNYDLQNYPHQVLDTDSPNYGANVFYLPGVDNPVWILNNSLSKQNINRSFMNFSTKYDFNDNISLTYRLGYDVINETQSFYINKGSSAGDAVFADGYLRTTNTEQIQTDHTFLINLNYSLSDVIGLTGIIGANSNRQSFDTKGTAYQNQITYGRLSPHEFSTSTNTDPFTGLRINNLGEVNLIGVYAQAEFDYSKYLYLTLSARNDWASNLEPGYNSQFYPSVSLSYIPTAAINGFKSDAFNYLKLRANISSGAQFPGSAFITRPDIVSNPEDFGGTVTETVSNFVPNPELQAALITDYEVGFETKFLKNKISLEASYYKRISKDQIFLNTVDASTGGTSTLVNLSEIETDGVELDLNIKAIDTDNFKWNISAIFFADEPIVRGLQNGQQLNIGGFSSLGNFAINDEPLGVIMGSFAVRNSNGNFLIDPSNGEVIPNADVGIADKIIGDPNPDWTTTLINSFTYKNFTLSGQLEYRHGGDIYSLTSQNLYFRGVLDIEGIDRDFYAAAVPGNIAATDSDGNFILETDADGNVTGIATAVDGNGNPIVNNILLPYEDTIFNNLEENDAENIYDGTTIRLREIALSYQFSKNILDRTPFGSMSFKIYGQNLWYDAVNFPDALNYDIESGSTGVGNARGLEFRTAPSTKNIGFSLKATF